MHMQVAKTRQEILDSYFWSQTEISRVFGISRVKAKKIYELANQIDNEELGNYRIEDTKVRKSTAFKVYGINPKTFVIGER